MGQQKEIGRGTNVSALFEKKTTKRCLGEKVAKEIVLIFHSDAHSGQSFSEYATKIIYEMSQQLKVRN